MINNVYKLNILRKNVQLCVDFCLLLPCIYIYIC